MKEMLAMQKHQEEEQAKEAALAANAQNNKKRLLTDLAAEEARQEEQVKRLQQLKEKEKESLIASLGDKENATDVLIAELMKSNTRNSDPQKVLEEMERERREMEEMFSIKAGEETKLREQEVLREMQRVMQEELRRENIRRQYEEGKKDIIDTALTNDMENDRAVDAVLASKGKQQQELISDLLEDEKYQREAFTAMFVKQDARHKEISSQVEQIQNELANLTMIEMTQKDLKMEFERDVMAEKRETLTKLLVQLMDQKSERAKELQTRLQEMEKARNEETDNYWLIQYQKLLDSKPKGMVEAEKNIDVALKNTLTKAGAEDYIPVFAMKGISLKQLSYMKDKELSELGVHNAYLRQKILMCADEYAKTQESLAQSLTSGSEGVSGATPSAPADPDAPSAPPSAKLGDNDSSSSAQPSAPSAPLVETFQSKECVVCMENKVRKWNTRVLTRSLMTCFLICSATSFSCPAATCAAVGSARTASSRVRCAEPPSRKKSGSKFNPYDVFPANDIKTPQIEFILFPDFCQNR